MTKNLSPEILVFADKSRYPNIPEALIEHVRLCYYKSVKSRLLEELRINPEKTSQACDNLFCHASKITGYSPAALLAATGFSPRDLNSTRLESALAEIKAIIFLNAQNFHNIQPINAQPTRMADFMAYRGGEKYAVEVADSTYNAQDRFSVEQLASWIASRYRGDKADQLAETVKTKQCQRKAFVVFIDTWPTLAVQTHREFWKAAEGAWIEVGPDHTLHICVITGKETPGCGPDDAIFPDWP